MVFGKSFRLYHKTDQNNVLSVLYENKYDKSKTLLFESGAIGCLSSQETEKLKPLYSLLTDVYGCLGILNLSIDEKQNVLLYLVCITGCISVGKIGNSEIFVINDTQFIPLIKGDSTLIKRDEAYQLENRMSDINKILNSGTFYFSWAGQQCPTKTPAMDLTLCAQKSERSTHTDNRFFWNRMLHLPFKSFDIDTDKWLLKVMAGGVNISTVYVGGEQAKACLISRLSCERAGTRFNVRGTNDHGHVANFVETEQVIYIGNKISSYIVIRGSIPLFWEQTGVQVGAHKLKLSRGTEISQAAYDRHIALVQYLYGEQVLVNLVGHKEGEDLIGKKYESVHKKSRFNDQITFIKFDYHRECPRGKEDRISILKKKMDPFLEEFGFYYNVPSGKQYQRGTFRVNCIDCLDRTNRVQTFIGLHILQKQLKILELDTKPTLVTRFIEVYTSMWQNNGDQISRLYAGTGALEGKSKIRDGTLSMARTIQNNFLDSGKQEAYDILLTGKSLTTSGTFHKARSLLPLQYLHLPTPILKEISNRFYEFAEAVPIKVAVGTWNVNGGKHFDSILYRNSNPLSDWLFDAFKSKPPNLLDLSLEDNFSEVDPEAADLIAVGFEEIVDLNAQNIMNASTSNQEEWSKELIKEMSKRGHYVQVCSVQLVGVCLFLFTKPKFARYIRDVAIDQVKTGLKGATGNKGGVGIRLQLFGTSLCFICSHFAAGQKQIADRNNDFREIQNRLFNNIGRKIHHHDYVFWCGDFNYRIDMPIDDVKQLVREEKWDELLENDQLLVQKNAGNCFKDYQEGLIRFAPTYKYDNNSDDYDTSEKSRIPAWTDRVLFRKFNPTRKGETRENMNYGEILYYCRAELKTSDHRPVIGEYKIDILKVDTDKLSNVFRQVIRENGPLDSTIIIREDNNTDENDSAVHDPDYFQAILDVLEQQTGKVVFARFGSDNLCVTLKDGRSAVQLANERYIDVRDKRFVVELKTPNWTHLIEEEVTYGINNTVPLIEHRTHFNIDDLEEYDIHTGSRSNSPDSPEADLPVLPAAAPVPSRPPPPSSAGSMMSHQTQAKPVRPAPPPPRPVAPSARPESAPSLVSDSRPPLHTSILETVDINDTLNSSIASTDSKDTSFNMPPPNQAPPNLPTRPMSAAAAPDTIPKHFSDDDDEDYEEDDDEEDCGSAPPPSFAPPPAFAPPPTASPPRLPPVPNGPPPVPARRPPPSIPPRKA